MVNSIPVVTMQNNYGLNDTDITSLKDAYNNFQPATATSFFGGLDAATNNFLNLAKSGLDAVGIPQFESDNQQKYYKQTSGITAVAGELFNPINVLIGLAGGEALGVAGETLGSAATAATGITGSQLVGQTAANVLPKVVTGAAEGMGWTLLDHEEQKASGINSDLTAQQLALGATAGGGLGAVGGLISHYLAPEADQAIAKIATDPDVKLNTITASADKQYNPQNKMGYNLDIEQPAQPTNIQTTAPAVTEVAPENLQKIGLQPDSEILDRDRPAILRAQALADNYNDLQEIDDAMLGNKQFYDTSYHNILNNSEFGKYVASEDNLAIRQAIHNEYDSLTPEQIGAGKLVNELNDIMYSDAQGLNVNRGFVDSYISQAYNPLRLEASTSENFADKVGSALSNASDKDALIDSYEGLRTRDVNPTYQIPTSNPYKARVFHFKDAQSQWEIEKEFGYPTHISTKVYNQISKASDLHARVATLGTEDPKKVLAYFAKIKEINPQTAQRKINEMLNINAKPNTASDALMLGGEVIRAAINTSRVSTAVLKPLYGLINASGDLLSAHVNAWGRYGLSSVMRSLIREEPTKEIAALAKLPNDWQTWTGLMNEFKNDFSGDVMDKMGLVTNNLRKTNRLLQSAALKLGGMHILDRFIRSSNLKLIANILKEQYAKDGLETLLPGLDKDILKQSINADGYLSPQKLTNIADTKIERLVGISDIPRIDAIKQDSQRYRDVASKLYSEYARINNTNPIYSNSLRFINRLDPAVAAGARTVAWQLRMIAGLYNSFLTGVYKNNKVLGYSGIAAAATAMALLDTAQSHVIASTTGEKEYNKKVPIINKKLATAIPNDFIRNWSINTLDKMVPLTMMYNAPIVYGSGAKAVKAAAYEFLPDTWGGNKQKARENIVGAMPWLGLMTNLFANNTNDLYQRSVRGY